MTAVETAGPRVRERTGLASAAVSLVNRWPVHLTRALLAFVAMTAPALAAIVFSGPSLSQLDHGELVVDLRALPVADRPPAPDRARVGELAQELRLTLASGRGEGGERRTQPAQGEGTVLRDAQALLQPLLPPLPEKRHLPGGLQPPLSIGQQQSPTESRLVVHPRPQRGEEIVHPPPVGIQIARLVAGDPGDPRLPRQLDERLRPVTVGVADQLARRRNRSSDGVAGSGV